MISQFVLPVGIGDWHFEPNLGGRQRDSVISLRTRLTATQPNRSRLRPYNPAGNPAFRDCRATADTFARAQPDRAAMACCHRARIQATLKPKCLAPATSNPLDETNSTSSFFKPSVFSTSGIAIRVRFEFPRAVNAEGRVEKSIKTGILDQSRQH